MNEKYDFNAIEAKWQKRWEEGKVFEVKEAGKKPKFYVLDMFPYPSGLGLHMGHAFVFSLGDIYARFKRLQGYNVLYPIGYDALGLPAENAAIKAGIAPKKYTDNSIKNFMKQQKAMGWSYDWSRVLRTDDSEFYRWDQWIFLKMLEKGIAYRKKAPVNWCKKCETVLANEQVVNGCCWRHEDTQVEIKHLEQWFFKITDYADELLSGLDKLDWPERAKKLERNWIGRSEGTEIEFEVIRENKSLGKFPIFTTRPDTLFGVTFMVVSAQHPRLMELVTKEQEKAVKEFIKKLKGVSEKEMESLDKEGVFTGSYAINPLSGDKVPIYAGNFVVADYGSGMVMAVPAHDQRDYEFAKKYGIEIKQVIEPIEGKIENGKAFTTYGKLVNSGVFNGLDSSEAKIHITNALKEKKLGKATVQYKLRDWLVSRQRYWGTPIPVVYCDKCGIVAVPEKDLPVELPEKVIFGKGNPLLTNEKWVNVKCPKCGGKAKRETDTMDTFVNSSWYMMRYCDPKNEKKIFDPKKVDYWMPVDQYIGGPEHITMHLIYARFYTKFLRDLGIVKFDEPATRYFTQGIVHGPDGEKMSKSKGNVVEPLEFIKKYGADTLRLALVSFASPDNDSVWDEKIVQGSHKFLNKVYAYFSNFNAGKSEKIIESKLNKTVKQVTEEIGDFKHNLAIIKLRQLFESFEEKSIDKKTAEAFLKLLHVYCPFVTEELWEKLGEKGFISVASWPKFDESKIDEKLEQAEKAVDKTVSDVVNIISLLKEKQGKEVEKIYIYVMPFELGFYDEKSLSVRVGKEVKVYSVADKVKEDPENFSKKAKPGRPAIYAK